MTKAGCGTSDLLLAHLTRTGHHDLELGVVMSDEWDDADRRILQGGKAENDWRAKHGLPLDGNYDRTNRADDLRGSANGGEAAGCVAELLKVTLVVTLYLIGYAIVGAALLIWAMLTAIFSKRR